MRILEDGIPMFSPIVNGDIPYDRDILLASCDGIYFNEHGHEFINSCLAHNNNCHVNIINPSLENIDYAIERNRKDDRFTFTMQNYSEGLFRDFEEYRSYLASSRFLLVNYFFELGVTEPNSNRYMILDIDCVVRKEIIFPHTDFGIYKREYETHPGMKVAAGIVYVSDHGRPFISSVVENIKALYSLHGNKFVWFNDQMAINTAYEIVTTDPNNPLSVTYFGQKDMDWEFDEAVDSAIYTGKGPRKHKSPEYKAEKSKYA